MKTYVKIRENSNYVEVPIEINKNREIDNNTREKWQRLLNVIVELNKNSAALIMQIKPNGMEVFIASQNQENPYIVGDSHSLGSGLYCETVIGTDNLLSVDDALQSLIWENNPDINLNMKSYYGLPLKWPNSSFFGTICILDSSKLKFRKKEKLLMYQFQALIESDLISIANLEKANKEIGIFKNSSKNMLSFLNQISSDIRDPLNSIFSLTDLASKGKIKSSQAFETINENISSIIGFLDQIGDQSRLQQETVVMDDEIIDLEDLINSIKSEQTSNLFDSENRITFDITECKYRFILANKNDLKTIFDNLIKVSNNIETENMKIQVHIKNFKDIYGITNQFTFKYNGKIFDDETLERIFDPYFNQKSIENNEELSLAVVKKLANNINASINCYTNNISTVFVIDFNSVKIEYENLKSYKLRNNISKFNFIDLKTLVISAKSDDFNFLNHYGMDINYFTDIQEAYNQFIFNRFDLIIINYDIDTITSKNFASKIRAIKDNYYAIVPIINLNNDLNIEANNQLFNLEINSNYDVADFLCEIDDLIKEMVSKCQKKG